MPSVKELLHDNNTKKLGVIGSPSDSFEAIVDILGVSSEEKLLGELVYFTVQEGPDVVLSLGQLTDVRTENKWHEEPSFKAVIKRHGYLPHLSGVADNRIAKLNVQSSFKLHDTGSEAYKLANSPSTGSQVSAMNNEIMTALLDNIITDQNVSYIGKAYDTDVLIPFWFKHFGSDSKGAGDAYHIGIFGKTGSGKTTTAAQVLRGYCSNSDKMSILVLDPQEQFYKDSELLPNGLSFKDKVIEKGMNYRAIKVPDDVHLPNEPELFAELLDSTGFVRRLFRLNSAEKRELMVEQIQYYIDGRMNNPSFDLANENAHTLLTQMLTRFVSTETPTENSQGYSNYVGAVYSSTQHRNNLINRINDALFELQNQSCNEMGSFNTVLKLFQKNSSDQISLDDMVDHIVNQSGYLYVLNLSPKGSHKIGSDNIQALLIKLICNKIIEKGENLYSEGLKANCLVVMDEAHRYTNASSSDQRIKELNKQIIDAVRTTRKYGVGYMFISQTLESIDNEIIQQMRVFGFGYGLTMGTELSKVKQIINDDNAVKFYRSFIDPSSNKKYPFMFHGPISPLSFTGSPLFLEMTG